ncbi:hypothetical protein BJV82DRAFT_671077 [Fennellomyces sp. T-0311]|nr:hypothetical protein BJV82DRAFT_671077 [Fennellomyces sp. T-0311]
MATKSRICEVCHKYCFRRKIYEMPLPVFIESRNKKIALCLACRQKYYKHNPEADTNEKNRRQRQCYGGKLGVQMYNNHLAIRRARKMEKIRDQRRAILRQAFGAHGITEVDESDPGVRHFILYGYNPDLTQDEAISEIVQDIPFNTRCRALMRRLSKHDIGIFTYIGLYSQYLHSGVGKLDDIVNMVLEINWLLKNTTYTRYDSQSTVSRPGLRRYTLRGNSSNDPILKALREFIYRRVVNGQWNDIISKPDTISQLPPKSLWQRIQRLNPEIWQEVAKDLFFPAGIEQCQDKLLLLDMTDWGSFTNDILIQVLDKGAILFGKRSLSHPIAFSLAMIDAIGKESFGVFVESNRKIFMEKITSFFIKPPSR